MQQTILVWRMEEVYTILVENRIGDMIVESEE